MNSRKNDFSYLTGQAYAAFGESHAQVKERFKDFPMCLMDYIDNGGHEEHIEISFDEENASVTYCFDTGRMLLLSTFASLRMLVCSCASLKDLPTATIT